jgi:hypothetical protein
LIEQREVDVLLGKLQEIKRSLEMRVRIRIHPLDNELRLLPAETKILEDIANMASPEFTEPLVEMLKPPFHGCLQLRVHVEKALVAIGSPAVPSLLALLDSESAFEAATILGQIGSPLALKPVLEKAIKENDLLIPAIWLCQRVGGQDAISFLNIVIAAYKPLSFPANLLKRRQNEGRRLLTVMATEALEKIRS